MRRVVYFGALVTSLVFTAPVSAQNAPSSLSSTGQHPWQINATIGPSFGTLGTAPATSAAARYAITDRWSLAGEAGMFRGTPVERPVLATATTPSTLNSNDRSNAYHFNANLYYRAPELGRLMPYATAGVGVFRTAMQPAEGRHSSAPFALTRETHAASNFGAGLTYRLNDWLGASADYRMFVLNMNGSPTVNRFTTGVSILFH